MKKLFAMMIVIVIALQVLACTNTPLPSTQARPNPAPSFTPGPASKPAQSPVPSSASTLVATLKPATVPAVTTPPNVISTPILTPASTPTSIPKSDQTPAPTQTTPPVAKLSVEEVKLKLDSGSTFVLVDVRSRADYDKGHLATAVSIPIEEIPTRYIEIPPASEVIVYAACNWGDTAGTRAVQMLLEKGLKNVKEMDQGFSAWQKANYPVIQTAN